jgi:hypothetical protein
MQGFGQRRAFAFNDLHVQMVLGTARQVQAQWRSRRLSRSVRWAKGKHQAWFAIGMAGACQVQAA